MAFDARNRSWAKEISQDPEKVQTVNRGQWMGLLATPETLPG